MKRKSTDKKMKRNVKKPKTVDYNGEDDRFRANVILGPNVNVSFEFTLKKENLHYDDLEDVGYGEMDKKYPEDSYPKSEIGGFEIFCSETEEWCPVVRESDEGAIRSLEKEKKTSRFLVLPEYMYHITPECKLWMTLKENGILGEEEEFDSEKMKKILKSLKNV